MTQLPLFDKRPPRGSIDDRFEEFHRTHPEVYAELRDLALSAVRAGRKRIGIGELFEVYRWHSRIKSKDSKGLKANNDFRALYARKLAAEEKELAQVFEFRARRTG